MARKILKTTGLDELQANNEEIAKKVDELVTAGSTPASKPFKKPSSDYYRLDLVTRGLNNGKMTETIKMNYKEYLRKMAAAEGVSVTKYIHNLIEKDMKKNKKEYQKVCKVIKG
jgi:hypothetical protein